MQTLEEDLQELKAIADNNPIGIIEINYKHKALWICAFKLKVDESTKRKPLLVSRVSNNLGQAVRLVLEEVKNKWKLK